MDKGGFSPELARRGSALQRRPVRGYRRHPARRRELGAADRRGRADWRRSSRRSSARCWSGRSTRASARGSARITRRAPMSSGWWCRRSSSRCARTGTPSRLPAGDLAESRRRRRRRSPTSARFPRTLCAHPRARPRLRHRQLPLCRAGADEAARRRGAGALAEPRRQEALEGSRRDGRPAPVPRHRD